ncbi:MAG: ribonuclease HI [Owenweeksia sp.]|nr:ribonuclease HI [Owenweeksia sp.]
MRVDVYTDGAASGNPGPGGYGIVMESGNKRKELSAGYRKTTNNRMELLATIVAMQNLRKKDIDLHIFSDSKYVVDAVNKGWLFSWEKKNYKAKKNVDLWKQFLQYYRKYKPELHWVKGHNNHPQNERCDQLAVQAYKKTPLQIDDGFEQPPISEGSLF